MENGGAFNQLVGASFFRLIIHKLVTLQHVFIYDHISVQCALSLAFVSPIETNY